MSPSVFTLICSFVLFSVLCGHINTQNTDCECVPYYLCDNGTINTNGENVIDIRIREDDCTYLEICCQAKDVLEEPSIRAPDIPKKKACGYRNPDGVGYRISGDFDNEAQFGEFPWVTAILHKGPNDVKHAYKCGGTLIHPQVVLTTAHCIANGNSFVVRVGEWDTKTTQEFLKHQERKVVSAVLHRDYKPRLLHNDMALLFLESPVNLTEHINVACLPPKDSVVLSSECFVSGWGKDKFESDGVYQNILKKIELPVVERGKCQRDFRKTRLGRHFALHRSFMCAGGQEGKDACTGDGGAPLVCPIPDQEDRYQVVGMVAWGIGCGTEGVPGAYADVAYLRNWVDEQMNKRKYGVDSYRF
ncbi:hypothetical protein Zmor_002459 [Zophobas morio]|uniref:Phenoloxidase-activating factor 2 n=1 Tax=Zophobas morio TaxID=2755281 RepID=A0AA38J103_9CUCU|nr:hypothetical protein Zmor_002459 [Zophobas morio]